MAQNDILEIDPGRKALLAGVALLAVLAPFVGGGLKPAPVAELARSLASSFVPAPKESFATVEPAAPPARAVHGTRRHSQPAAIEVHQAVLAAPAIKPVTSPMLVLAPEIATEPPPSTAEATVCRAPQSLPGTHLSGPQVCLPQQEWERLKQQKLVLMPDGRTVARVEDGMKGRPCYTAGSAAASSITPWPINCF